MFERKKRNSARERLILAGIAEIEKNGVKDFSMRKVAESCSVSCATPYKHFKDKQAFIAEIIKYVNKIWYERQLEIKGKYPDDVKLLLTETSVEYIRFLLLNPHFRSIIMLKDENMTEDQVHEKSKISNFSMELINRYCAEIKMPEEVKIIKTFIIRSLIYGAALMIDNGEITYSEKNIGYIRKIIEREFNMDWKGDPTFDILWKM
ncbi:MAG: TetR/AcrR family transcriptional regulator [Lachnospiraceae bacterium]|nr:TetR/AcrR family transcriptional regulator [Lachnospiraceae bacterium]